MEINMVEVFKTNVRRQRQATLLFNILSRQFPLLRINFDLDDCDKILRVEGDDISQEKIAELVIENGYNCEILE
jgi:hypothetical protein